MKLADAKICIDCEEIFWDIEWQCPRCASTASHPLRAWIKPLYTALQHIIETLREERLKGEYRDGE